MSIRYSGGLRTRDGVERVKAYKRARERARRKVATLHQDEFTAIAAPLRSGHRPGTREYWSAQAKARRAVAGRHPEDFARLLDQELVAERMARR